MKKSLKILLSCMLVAITAIHGASLYLSAINGGATPTFVQMPISQEGEAFGQHVASIMPSIIFISGRSGSYTFSTYQPGDGSTMTSNTIYLYTSSGTLLSSTTATSLTYTLAADTAYRLAIYNSINTLQSVNCYLVVKRSGALYGSNTTYSNLCKDFEKIGNYSFSYNCASYALGMSTSVWFWGPNNSWSDPALWSSVHAYLTQNGYIQSTASAPTSIMIYGGANGINHFAKKTLGEVTAKLGSLELVRHSQANAYYNSSSSYGDLLSYYEYVGYVADSQQRRNADTEIFFETDSSFYDTVIDTVSSIELVYGVSDYSIFTDNPDAYETVASLGEESIPYLLKFVTEKKSNNCYLNMFLVLCANKMNGRNSIAGSMGDKISDDLNAYTPEWYAMKLWEEIK